jgi:SHS2 domain-containing protein
VSPARDYEFVEGATSDLSFVARGEDLAGVFRAAAEALLAATLEDPDRVGDRVRRVLSLEEPDRELLLLRFLNELVYLRDAEGLLLRPHRLELSEDGGARLDAELAGEACDPARHAFSAEVKAVTAHGLRLERRGGCWTAAVTLDV